MKSPTYTVPPASGSPKPKPAAPTWFSRHFNWYADEPHAISFGRGSRCIVADEIMWPVAARVQRVSKPGADRQLIAVVWLDVFSPATGKLRRELVMIDASGGLDTPAGADRLDFVFRELIGAPRFDREHREIDARSAVQHLGGDAAVEETERAAAECLANVDQGATPIVDAADDKLVQAMSALYMVLRDIGWAKREYRLYIEAVAEQVCVLNMRPVSLKIAPALEYDPIYH